jgi:hypothetical protein
MALRKLSSFRMAATTTTLNGLPAALRRCANALINGLQRIAAMVACRARCESSRGRRRYCVGRDVCPSRGRKAPRQPAPRQCADVGCDRCGPDRVDAWRHRSRCGAMRIGRPCVCPFLANAVDLLRDDRSAVGARRTRRRPGPGFVTVGRDPDPDSRRPSVASAWLLMTLLATRTRRGEVERFEPGLNIQDPDAFEGKERLKDPG